MTRMTTKMRKTAMRTTRSWHSTSDLSLSSSNTSMALLPCLNPTNWRVVPLQAAFLTPRTSTMTTNTTMVLRSSMVRTPFCKTNWWTRVMVTMITLSQMSSSMEFFEMVSFLNGIPHILTICFCINQMEYIILQNCLRTGIKLQKSSGWQSI